MSRLYNIIHALATASSLSFTRATNSYVNSTDFARITGAKAGKTGVINWNLYLSSSIPANTTGVKIGSIDNTTLAAAVQQTVPPQTASNQTMLVSIDTSGNLMVGNGTNSALPSGWYRQSIPIMLA